MNPGTNWGEYLRRVQVEKALAAEARKEENDARRKQLGTSHPDVAEIQAARKQLQAQKKEMVQQNADEFAAALTEKLKEIVPGAITYNAVREYRRINTDKEIYGDQNFAISLKEGWEQPIIEAEKRERIIAAAKHIGNNDLSKLRPLKKPDWADAIVVSEAAKQKLDELAKTCKKREIIPLDAFDVQCAAGSILRELVYEAIKSVKKSVPLPKPLPKDSVGNDGVSGVGGV